MTGEEGQPESAVPAGRSGRDAGDLDFWSFVDLAGHRLSAEFGFEHHLATRVLLTLNRASMIVTYDLEAAVHRPRGLSWAGFRLLLVTWLAGPLEPKRAAVLAGMSRAAVSSVLKPLLAAGLLNRTPDERDGRSVLLSLTEHGERTMLEVFGAHHERERQWTQSLTETEQRILIMLLEKFIAGRARFDVRERS